MKEAMNVVNELQRVMDGNAGYFPAGLVQMLMIVLAVAAVIGLVICCFGLKLSRVLSAIVGLALGALLGAGISFGIGLEEQVILIVTAAVAVICAVLFGVLRRFGIFFLILLQTIGIYVGIVRPGNLILAGIGLAVGILMAVLSVFWTEPIVVIVTGICGGLTAGNSVAALLGVDSSVWIGYVIGAVMALIGIWIQFMMQSRKIGRKEEVYSKKVKEEVSMESEVEKARRILDEDDGKNVDIEGANENEKDRGAKDIDEDGNDKGSKDTDIKIIEEEM